MQSPCLKGATNGLVHSSKKISFDHLVGASEIDQPCMAPIQPAMARPISSGESS
jgi:hypothetical protein